MKKTPIKNACPRWPPDRLIEAIRAARGSMSDLPFSMDEFLSMRRVEVESEEANCPLLTGDHHELDAPDAAKVALIEWIR